MGEPEPPAISDPPSALPPLPAAEEPKTSTNKSDSPSSPRASTNSDAPSSPRPSQPEEEPPKQSTNSNSTASPTPSQRYTTPRLPVSLVQPSQKKKKPVKVVRILRALFRSFPVFTPVCKFNGFPDRNRTTTGVLVTGTLYGFRRGRVSLCIQENPKCIPTLVIELAMQTSVLQKEMSLGMVRIALECEKRPADKEKLKLLDEPVWSMYCNGKKGGYGMKRDATDEDLNIMELLRASSMGAGVLPGNSEVEGPDGELAYMRAYFEHVVGSKDSETFYLISPEGNHGPELSIFFVRV
ncbi:protein MIZU-KUSSEI 1-like [Papaver somniferum]|uniref:protein MIZU-KUSSEI 1-like n=1 Tax=Papaver somniferum TaxID=3469 RepID=UPI000E704A9B|nr:protein MIZU-KUSSEI 1-like [Papaver somniferum]